MIETQARHIVDFNAVLVNLVAHHQLAPPLLTPSVVQDVWEKYQGETGKAAFPFCPEMVYEAAASYVVTEEMLYTVLHLPLLGKAFIYYVQQDFLAVRQHCQEVPVQVPWVLSGKGGDPPQHRLWTAERLSYVVQCANGTKHLQDWKPGVHAFQQDRECSIAAEAFYLVPWRKRFPSVDVVRTFGYTSGLDEEWKSSAEVHNLTSVQNVIEPYVNAPPKMFIAACATVIAVMILFGTLLVLAIRRLRRPRSRRMLFLPKNDVM